MTGSGAHLVPALCLLVWRGTTKHLHHERQGLKKLWEVLDGTMGFVSVAEGPREVEVDVDS